VNILLSLTHWWWMLVSPAYRQHVRDLNQPNLVPETPGTTTERLEGGQIIHGVHPAIHCHNQPCAIHHPSDHHMHWWKQNWRDDRKLMERICPHGIGHPDPDHMAFLASKVGPGIAAATGVHGCDGCCDPYLAQAYPHQKTRPDGH
jgi:hypothetical protein